MMIGGSALRGAADEVIERGKRFAAHFMEADAADRTFADGQFTIAGTALRHYSAAFSTVPNIG
jgi:carbon-monoxide dehydrogenase large subunit